VLFHHGVILFAMSHVNVNERGRSALYFVFTFQHAFCHVCVVVLPLCSFDWSPVFD